MKKQGNPWSSDDEKEHFPSVLEWWCTEGFLHDVTHKKQWSYKGSFTEWCTTNNELGSTYDFTLFDYKTNEYVSRHLRSDMEKLDVSYDDSDNIITRFNDSYLTGSYPDYKMKYDNSEKDIFLKLQYQAQSLPHWITQDITGGYLPMGFGFYRYGFIPRNTVNGILHLQGEDVKVKGTGYYEHVWGDFSYKNPLADFSFVKKSLSIYQKLTAWWIYHHTLKIPDSLKFSSENNPLGYDWMWAVLDNGWSVFLGNILFWVAEGPIFGTCILTKDGKHYQEFCNVHYKYKQVEHSKKFDFVYPTKIEIIAKKDDEKLRLTAEMIMPCREFVTPLHQKKWLAFVICEAPGKVTGTYSKKDETVTLSGDCKIEPQRQVSVYGHNLLSIDFIKPPKGVGISVDFESHYLKKKLSSTFCFNPLPKIQCSMKKIHPPKKQ